MGVRGVVGALGRGAARMGKVPRTRLTAGAGAVALAVAVPFGGLEEDHEVTSPAVAAQVGEVLHADPLDITVTGASVVEALQSYAADGTASTLFGPDVPGHLVLVLKADVVNTWTSSVRSGGLLKAVANDPGQTPRDGLLYTLDDAVAPAGSLDVTGVYSVDDATPIATLNPGITYHLAIVWEVAGLPATLSLGVARMSYDEVYISPGDHEWQHPDPAYKLQVPVVDKRGDAQQPADWTPSAEPTP